MRLKLHDVDSVPISAHNAAHCLTHIHCSTYFSPMMIQDFVSMQNATQGPSHPQTRALIIIPSDIKGPKTFTPKVLRVPATQCW